LLAVGYYTQLLEFFWYFMAALCVMAANALGGIRAALLAFASSALLALLLCAFNLLFLLPYLLFMGLHPIVNAVIVRYRISPVIAHPVKAIWFCAWLLAMIRFTGLFLFVDLGAGGPVVILIVAAVSLPAYFLYELAVRLVSRDLDKRLRRFRCG
jgi:hypothetical protein